MACRGPRHERGARARARASRGRGARPANGVMLHLYLAVLSAPPVLPGRFRWDYTLLQTNTTSKTNATAQRGVTASAPPARRRRPALSPPLPPKESRRLIVPQPSGGGGGVRVPRGRTGSGRGARLLRPSTGSPVAHAGGRSRSCNTAARRRGSRRLPGRRRRLSGRAVSDVGRQNRARARLVVTSLECALVMTRIINQPHMISIWRVPTNNQNKRGCASSRPDSRPWPSASR